MTLPFPPRTVPEGKITQYLLNPIHKKGGPKSVFFCAFGFSVADWGVMRDALEAHPDHNPIAGATVNEWGTTYVVRCNVVTPDSRNPCIDTVWIVETGQSEARLVTAYPA